MVRAAARIAHHVLGEVRVEAANRAPAPALRAHVRGLQGYVEQAPAPVSRREYPFPGVVMILGFGPPIRVYDSGDLRRSSRHPGGFAAGIDGSFTLTEHEGFQSGVQVNLSPVGARLFFDLPLDELRARAVAFRDVAPPGERDLTERLEALATWDARFDLVEEVLAKRLAAARLDVRGVAWAASQIERSGGRVPIRALERELGWSPKRMIARFRDQIGVPPKLFSRIVRFDRLATRLRSGAAPRFTDLAQEFGYFDQSHLVRDVRQFTGVTPSEARNGLAETGGLFG